MRARAGEGSGTLILFTVCAQWAVGIALAGFFADVQGQGLDAAAVALVLLGIGGLAALLHLRRPGRAPRALANHRHSPLSREIVAGLVFALLLSADLAVGDGAAGGPLGFLAALGGILFLYAMADVYRLRTVPAWNTPATWVAFLSTALGLGLASGALRADGLALLAAVAVVVGLLVMAVHLHRLGRRGGAAAESARIVRVRHQGVWGARIATALLGAGVLLAVAFSDEGGTWHRPAILLAVVLLFASELLGRWLFYAFHRRVGL